MIYWLVKRQNGQSEKWQEIPAFLTIWGSGQKNAGYNGKQLVQASFAVYLTHHPFLGFPQTCMY